MVRRGGSRDSVGEVVESTGATLFVLFAGKWGIPELGSRRFCAALAMHGGGSPTANDIC